MSVQDLSQVTKFLMVCATGSVIGAFSAIVALSGFSTDPDMVMNFVVLASVLFSGAFLFLLWAFVSWGIQVFGRKQLESGKTVYLAGAAIVLFVIVSVAWLMKFGGDDESTMEFATPFVCTAFQNAFAKDKNYISLNTDIQLMCEKRIAKAHKDYKEARSKLKPDT